MTHPPVLFLDFDGVLNSVAFWNRRGSPTSIRITSNAEEIDPGAVALLNSVLDTTGAVVVFSTAWRNSFSVVDLDGLLRERGFTGCCIDATPTIREGGSYGERRVWEIRRWLNAHPEVVTWAAVDDIDLGSAGLGHERFVHTDVSVGLTTDAAERLGVMLGGAA